MDLNMTKFFVCFFICVLLVVSGAPLTSAQQSTILFFSPQRIDVSDKNQIQEIRLTNTSDIARSYSIKLQNFIMNEEGGTVSVDDFEYSAKRMVRYVPRKFDLAPGKTQTVRFMARISPDKPDGEYHSHIEFLENTKRRAEINKDITNKAEIAKMQAKISYAAAIPLTVSKGEIQTTLSMQDVTIKTDEKGARNVHMILKREGNGQGKLYLDADYIAPDETTAKAASRRTVFVYRELTQRKHKFSLDLLGDNVDENGSIRVKLFNRNLSEEQPVQEVIIPLGS